MRLDWQAVLTALAGRWTPSCRGVARHALARDLPAALGYWRGRAEVGLLVPPASHYHTPPPPPTHTHTHPTPTTPTTHPPPPPPPPLPPCVLWLLLDSLAVQEMVEAAGPGWVRRAKHIRGCLEEGGACEVCTVVSRSAGQAGPVAKCCRAARATSDDAACKPSLPDARRLQPTSPLLCPVRLSWQVVRVLFVTPCAHLQCVDCTFKSVQQAPACAKCGTPYKMQAGVVQSCCRDFVRPGLYIRAAWCLVERCRCLLWRAWGRGRRGGGEGPRIACRRLHTLGHF